MGRISRILPSPKRFAPMLVVAVAVAANLPTPQTTPASPETALDRYVHAPDPHFHFDLVRTLTAPGYTTYVLDMTSQQYLTEPEVSHPVWKHWLVIIKPDVVKTSTGLLYINGGSLGRPAPDKADPQLADIALSTGAVVADLHGVPNEPLIVAGETRERSEDAIIAYTWDKFLRTGVGISDSSDMVPAVSPKAARSAIGIWHQSLRSTCDAARISIRWTARSCSGGS